MQLEEGVLDNVVGFLGHQIDRYQVTQQRGSELVVKLDDLDTREVFFLLGCENAHGVTGLNRAGWVHVCILSSETRQSPIGLTSGGIPSGWACLACSRFLSSNAV